MEEQQAPTPISVTAPTTLQSAESESSAHVPAIASPSPPPSVADLTPAQEEEEAAERTTTSSSSTVTPPTTTPTTRTASSVPASTKRDVEDGKHYINRKFQCTSACKAYEPTLEELQKMSFSDYVRHVVLDGARVNPSQEGLAERLDKEDASESPSAAGRASAPDAKTRVYSEGMAKVTLPKGFWKEEGIGQDRTGRGPAWQKGTPLGDLVIPNPIRQCVRGIGGVYEYTLLDRPPVALHAFRELADAYYDNQLSGKKMPEAPKRKKKEPVKSSREKRLQHLNEIRKAKEDKKEASSEEDTEQGGDSKKGTKNDNSKKKEEEKKKKDPPTIEELERKFWKRLGPTMPPPDYGADMEGSLFGDDPACGWNLGRLDSFLHLLGPNLPGVTSPYLYMGMWASVFAAHTEDMNLLSINYLHAGAPKIWYAIAPGPDAQRYETLSEHYFAHVARDCKQFLRHKRCLLSPMILKKAGIKFTMQVQNPGDAMITMPGGYHFGFNSGFNVAEATNFGVPEWIPFGHDAKICMCRPDSVRIDMIRLERLHARYIKENKRKTSRRRKSYRDWGILHAKAHMKPKEESDSETESEDEDVNKASSNNQKIQTKPPKKPRMKEFWVEVMAPVPSSQRADYGRRVNPASQPAKKVTPRKRARSKGKGKQEPEEPKECWHLAKPMTRKGLVLHGKVLVFIPGAVNRDQQEGSDSSDSDSSSDEEEDEQCFAGIITEFTEEHCRVHFDRLPKDDDVWMHIESHKLFLDGGKWEALESKQKLPAKHYWKEQDSKRRCV